MDLWRSKLERRYMEILDHIVGGYPDALSSAEIAEAVGLTLSGTFNTYLSRLSTLGLIDRSKGEARASENLFP